MCWPARVAAVRRADARGATCPCRDVARAIAALRAGDDDRRSGGRRRRARPRAAPASTWSSWPPTTRGSATPARSTSSTADGRPRRPRLGVQLVGRQVRPVGRRRHDRPTLGRSTPGTTARSVAGRARRRVNHRRRCRHARDHRAVPAAPQPQPVDDADAEIEAVLGDELGVSTVVWLPYGLALDDDTDGHVDNVAAFSRPGVLRRSRGATTPPRSDRLRCGVNVAVRSPSASIARAEPIDVVVVPDAAVHRASLGRRVAVPYLNYYAVNGARDRAGVRPPRRRRHARHHRRAVRRTGGGRSRRRRRARPRRRGHPLHHPADPGVSELVGLPRPARRHHGDRGGVADRLPRRRQARRRRCCSTTRCTSASRPGATARATGSARASRRCPVPSTVRSRRCG